MTPDANGPWPPQPWQPIQQDIATAALWWQGDPARLHATTPPHPGAAGFFSTVAGRVSSFWSRQAKHPERSPIHLPAAADIAETAAGLLVGEAPSFTINETADELLDAQIDQDGVTAKLVQAAEIASALGGVYLRPVWDATLADRAILDVVHPDAAVPEFQFGRLVAVTFWRTLPSSGSTVWRHLARYTSDGTVEHSVHVGDIDRLGHRMPLDRHPATQAIGVNDDGVEDLGVDGLAAVYIPNRLPNRRHRHVPAGQADTAGRESLMEALDETWTAWIREIRLCKPRIVVPQEYLETRGRGKGATFDVDRDVFVGLEMDPTNRDAAGVTVAEFTLHTDQYAATCEALFTEIVVGSGYSPSAFGIHSDTTQTATEVDSRDARTTRTIAARRRYWQPAVARALDLCLDVNRHVFGHPAAPGPVAVAFRDAASIDRTARTVTLIHQAQAASIRTRVEMLHPDWTAEQVDAETSRIQAEQGVVVDSPFGL